MYSGDDATAAQLILAGGAGNISVTANVVPERVAAICAAALAGDESTVRELDSDLAKLNAALFIEANPMPVKYALAKMGRMRAGIRLPLTLPEGDAAAVVDAGLASVGL